LAATRSAGFFCIFRSTASPTLSQTGPNRYPNLAILSRFWCSAASPNLTARISALVEGAPCGRTVEDGAARWSFAAAYGGGRAVLYTGLGWPVSGGMGARGHEEAMAARNWVEAYHR
jgi:hypothetical protein